MKLTENLILNVAFCVLYLNNLKKAEAIDCYVCSTTNNSLKECGDPFNTNVTFNFLQHDCRTGRKNRSGLFPATSCIKVSGVFVKTKVKMVIRMCALDSGSLTQDTELVRNSHCGGFRYDDKRIRGCISTCKEDGCNSGHAITSQYLNLLLIIMLVIFTCKIF